MRVARAVISCQLCSAINARDATAELPKAATFAQARYAAMSPS